MSEIITILLSLASMLLGTAIIGFFRTAISAFKEQKKILINFHECIDNRFKEIDIAFTRLDTWKDEHEKIEERCSQDINRNIENLRKELQNILSKVLDIL